MVLFPFCTQVIWGSGLPVTQEGLGSGFSTDALSACVHRPHRWAQNMGQGGLVSPVGPGVCMFTKSFSLTTVFPPWKTFLCPCSNLGTNNITQGLASATAEQDCKGLPGLTLWFKRWGTEGESSKWSAAGPGRWLELRASLCRGVSIVHMDHDGHPLGWWSSGPVHLSCPPLLQPLLPGPCRPRSTDLYRPVTQEPNFIFH